MSSAAKLTARMNAQRAECEVRRLRQALESIRAHYVPEKGGRVSVAYLLANRALRPPRDLPLDGLTLAERNKSDGAS